MPKKIGGRRETLVTSPQDFVRPKEIKFSKGKGSLIFRLSNVVDADMVGKVRWPRSRGISKRF